MHIGQMVICVDDTFIDPTWAKLTLPVKGQIYSIRGITRFEYRDGPDVGLYLNEIINPIEQFDNYFAEMPFWIARFRPVKRTDISELKALLEKVPS